jgi:CheY-like chemotaxis protein
MPPRETEVDVAYALEASSYVVGVYALHLPASATNHPDALPFGVLLHPYTGRSLASTHFALLQATNHTVTGGVLYADAHRLLPVPFRGSRNLVVEPHERHEARARFLQRSAETIREWRLEEEAMAQALERAFAEGANEAQVRASLQSGEFEIVPDPFPSEKLPPARVLVIDRDATTVNALLTLGEVEVVTASSGWDALEHLLRGDFDLVLCAVSFDEWSGAKLYSMAAKGHPDVARRIVFVANESAVASAGTSSPALARVLSRPVDADAVRRLIAERRRGD